MDITTSYNLSPLPRDKIGEKEGLTLKIKYCYRGMMSVDEISIATCHKRKDNGCIDIEFSPICRDFYFPILHLKNDYSAIIVMSELFEKGYVDLTHYDVDFIVPDWEDDEEEEEEE